MYIVPTHSSSLQNLKLNYVCNVVHHTKKNFFLNLCLTWRSWHHVHVDHSIIRMSCIAHFWILTMFNLTIDVVSFECKFLTLYCSSGPQKGGICLWSFYGCLEFNFTCMALLRLFKNIATKQLSRNPEKKPACFDMAIYLLWALTGKKTSLWTGNQYHYHYYHNPLETFTHGSYISGKIICLHQKKKLNSTQHGYLRVTIPSKSISQRNTRTVRSVPIKTDCCRESLLLMLLTSPLLSVCSLWSFCLYFLTFLFSFLFPFVYYCSVCRLFIFIVYCILSFLINDI